MASLGGNAGCQPKRARWFATCVTTGTVSAQATIVSDDVLRLTVYPTAGGAARAGGWSPGRGGGRSPRSVWQCGDG